MYEAETIGISGRGLGEAGAASKYSMLLYFPDAENQILNYTSLPLKEY